MKNLFFFIATLILGSVLFSCSSKPAKGVILPTVFGDNMVLQQGENIAIWGQSISGGIVIVEIGNNKVSTRVKDSGKWAVELPAMSSGGPFDLNIIGEDTITFTNG